MPDCDPRLAQGADDEPDYDEVDDDEEDDDEEDEEDEDDEEEEETWQVGRAVQPDLGLTLYG